MAKSVFSGATPDRRILSYCERRATKPLITLCSRKNYCTLIALSNEYSLFFEDGRDDSEIEDPITWETVTPNGAGDCDDNGVFYILLNKFVPTSFEEIYFFDFDKIAHLEELNEKITAFFDEYIALLFYYASVQDIFKPFKKNTLIKKKHLFQMLNLRFAMINLKLIT